MLSDACIYPRYSWRATRRLISVQLGRTYRSERKERQTDCCNCDPCILAEGGRVSTKIVSKIVGLELITTTWPGFASANSPSSFAKRFRFPAKLAPRYCRSPVPKNIYRLVLYFFFSFATEHQVIPRREDIFESGPFCRKRFQVSWRPRWKSRFTHPFEKYIRGSSNRIVNRRI